MEQKVTTPVVKGLIISLLLIVFGLVIYFTGQMQNTPLQYCQYIILGGGIIWSCTYYAKQLNGNVTFGNIFGHGFKTTAVVTCIILIYTVLALKVLFPDMVDQIIEAARKNMQAQKNLTDDQIQQGLDFTRKFMLVFVIIGIMFFFAIVGAICSLIGAAVAKKNPQSPFQQPMQ